MDRKELFDCIQQLVMCHSPSGVEEEIDRCLIAQFEQLKRKWVLDQAGNIIIKIPGVDSSTSIAITAHKDEIGGIVKSIDNDGTVHIRKLGGAYPWVYGEGVVDLLGDNHVISGILSFGSRHVSHESPQKVQQDEKPLLWENVWVNTKQPKAALEQAGIRPGTRMVVGKHRKKPFSMGDYIASYTLDNKASLAILLALAAQLKSPAVDTYLVASAKEEVGAIGAMYFTQRSRMDALVALEICPKSSEYPIDFDERPVLLSQDGYGLYDEALNQRLVDAAGVRNIQLQRATLSQFGSDASIAMKSGHVARAACLSFPTNNTHGYEIAHMDSILNCIPVLEQFCVDYRVD